jgi:hypothetical protein
LGIGDWGLGIGDWGLGIGDLEECFFLLVDILILKTFFK